MEEILASIRRIISEDEPAVAAPAPVAEAFAAPAPAHEEVEDVLELTDPVKEEAAPIETHGDVEVHAAPPAPVYAAPPAPVYVAPAPVYVAPVQQAPAPAPSDGGFTVRQSHTAAGGGSLSGSGNKFAPSHTASRGS